MNTDHQILEPVAFVISENVQSGSIQEYEEWVKGINQAAKEFEGFLGSDVIRPRDPDHLEYVILGPLIKDLPQLLGIFISVVAISVLLTYPVMPLLTRLLYFWLYPSSKK